MLHVGYSRSQRLVVSGFTCTCPRDHHEPAQDVYLGAGLLGNLPAYIKKRELGKKLVLAADTNTYAAAGREAEAALKSAGFDVTVCLYEGKTRLLPDEAAVGALLMTMGMDTEFFLAVGSGTITDIVRVVAAQTERPFACVATAPSTVGYIARAAWPLRGGERVRLGAVCPEIALCDLNVLAAAPKASFDAGLEEISRVLAANRDWAAGGADAPYCPEAGAIIGDAAEKALSLTDAVRARTPEGARSLSEALLLAGIASMAVNHAPNTP